MISAVIFDLDGVIVDSNKAIFETYKQTARIIGEKEPESEQIRALLGQPSSINLKHLFGNNSEARVTYNEVVKRTHADLPFLPYVRAELRKIKIPKAIVTSKRKDNAEAVLRDLKELFETIITPEQTKQQKPHPEPLLLACTQLDITPENVAYVGDTIRDCETALNAGTKFIGFVHDGATSEEFKKAGANIQIRSFKELGQIILGM